MTWSFSFYLLNKDLNPSDLARKFRMSAAHSHLCSGQATATIVE